MEHFKFGNIRFNFQFCYLLRKVTLIVGMFLDPDRAIMPILWTQSCQFLINSRNHASRKDLPSRIHVYIFINLGNHDNFLVQSGYHAKLERPLYYWKNALSFKVRVEETTSIVITE